MRQHACNAAIIDAAIIILLHALCLSRCQCCLSAAAYLRHYAIYDAPMLMLMTCFDYFLSFRAAPCHMRFGSRHCIFAIDLFNNAEQ